MPKKLQTFAAKPCEEEMNAVWEEMNARRMAHGQAVGRKTGFLITALAELSDGKRLEDHMCEQVSPYCSSPNVNLHEIVLDLRFKALVSRVRACISTSATC